MQSQVRQTLVLTESGIGIYIDNDTAYIHTAVVNGALTVLHHPVGNETSFEQMYLNRQSFEDLDNNTGIPLGSQVSMNCAAKTSNNSLPIQIVWIRNGHIV